ncbi:MAG: hypothetical protein JWL90_26 [Chthoniobacteraceae bacterium]|nr:hypothetical protein [Chthoniobacteraceae bacterium]
MNRGLLRKECLLAPEHGGSNVKGGGPSSIPVEGESEQVLAAMEAPKPGEPHVSGTPDPGVPGSRTNPVKADADPEPSTDKPVTPPRVEGSGAGS